MPTVIQLSLWDYLDTASKTPVDADLFGLLDRVEQSIEFLPTSEKLGIAYGEEIELWASQIRAVMVAGKEMLLVELQQQSELSLVDVWLGLLLGDTGCSIRRQLSSEIEFSVDFYDRAGIWIVEFVRV